MSAELRHEPTGDPHRPDQPRIAHRCPSCGAQSLFIGAGGLLTCSVIGCKDPGAAMDVLDGLFAAAIAERDNLREQFLAVVSGTLAGCVGVTVAGDGKGLSRQWKATLRCDIAKALQAALERVAKAGADA